MPNLATYTHASSPTSEQPLCPTSYLCRPCINIRNDQGKTGSCKYLIAHLRVDFQAFFKVLTKQIGRKHKKALFDADLNYPSWAWNHQWHFKCDLLLKIKYQYFVKKMVRMVRFISWTTGTLPQAAGTICETQKIRYLSPQYLTFILCHYSAAFCHCSAPEGWQRVTKANKG